MKNAFVQTSNVKRFLTALSALEERGAQEACLVVVDGQPGLGKTTTLKHWVAQNGCIYLRAKKEWTPNWFMNELLEAMRVNPPHAFQKKYATALQELAFRQSTAMMERKSFGLVIDEADHVSSKASILETIRDISDMIELPTILVGMGRINDNLARFPQVASRISQKVRFEKASKEDVRGLIKQRCEVEVADCLVDFVLTVSQGFNRETLEAIANIERFGLRSDVGPTGVTMREMAGQIIINDRRTNQPVMVPEVL
ncbi:MULTISPECIES: ATP-binding protein [unclassified Ensifer]|uniref:AAA family ATPase n=1 Tax=unclassified Ensifer TaxID=2633371 RepID=UPI000813271D|nr:MULTISPECIES: ATP-binding protein [unclassified Ensifer]OCP17397.1 DNA transposition protein [Ensifer sp. LC54]OCP28697.1 DNA transposition protein [Ensifer sp. LC384]